MKILISSCVFGNNVRWNATSRRSEEVHDWASENGFELVPICPEHELFGTPRASIRLRQKDDEVLAIMGKQEVYSQLQDKCKELSEKKLKEYMQWDSIEIEVNLKLGNDAFKCYTCDFTHDYIDINADYRN